MAMDDGKVLASTIEQDAKRQKFEAMSSKAAREAKDLRNQILLEQAAVEVKREMTPLPSCLWRTTAMCWCHYSGDLS